MSHITVNLVDSFVKSANKIGTGSGEAKMKLPSGAVELIYHKQLESITMGSSKSVEVHISLSAVGQFLYALEVGYERKGELGRWSDYRDEWLKLKRRFKGFKFCTAVTRFKGGGGSLYLERPSDHPDKELYDFIFRTIPLSPLDGDAQLRCSVTFDVRRELREDHQGLLFTPDEPLIFEVVSFDVEPYVSAKQTSKQPPSLNEQLKARLKTQTESQALVTQRRGQSAFREALIKVFEGRCAVTGTDLKAALIASHIKPWSEASDEERLDPHNGLLLAAHYDSLFDQYLISFDERGALLYPVILQESLKRLGIDVNAQLHAEHLTSERRAYLSAHRARHQALYQA